MSKAGKATSEGNGDNTRPSRKPEDLVKQFGTYADSIAAFAFVQALAFSSALGSSKDFLRSVLRGWPLVIVVIVGANWFYLRLLEKCHEGEDALGHKPNLESKPHSVDFWVVAVRKHRKLIVKIALSLSIFAIALSVFGYWYDHQKLPWPWNIPMGI